jgi:hypothetical protein
MGFNYGKLWTGIGPLNHAFTLIDNFPAVLNFNWLFLKLNRFICN